MSHCFYRLVGLELRQLVLTRGERLLWSPHYAQLEDGVSSCRRVRNGKGSAHLRTEEGEHGKGCDQHSGMLACLGAEDKPGVSATLVGATVRCCLLRKCDCMSERIKVV